MKDFLRLSFGVFDTLGSKYNFFSFCFSKCLTVLTWGLSKMNKNHDEQNQSPEETRLSSSKKHNYSEKTQGGETDR